MPMGLIRVQKRTALMRPEHEGVYAIRVSQRGRARVSPGYLLKCGCCNEALEIFYDMEGFEINGVHGSLENWRGILLPLLRIK